MKTARDTARKIVDDIAADIKDRKGIGNEFEEIDEDIQREMLLSWVNLAEEHIFRAYDGS
jgi:hypothetical protein